MPADGRDAGRADVGHMAEILSAVRVGNVDLHRRDADRLHRVKQRDARVRIGGGVDDHAVHPVKVRLLDGIHQRALVVGLEE